MDTLLAGFDFVTANLGAIVTLAFAAIGVLSQAAALFNLAGLAQVSTTLHDVVQFAAGNWGKAVNAVKLIETYRASGPAAALAELAALAAPAAPKDGGGSLPPGAAPAALLLAVALGGFIACAPVTAELDSLTKTSLADRCETYRAGGVAASALAASFPELAGLATASVTATAVDVTGLLACTTPPLWRRLPSVRSAALNSLSVSSTAPSVIQAPSA